MSGQDPMFEYLELIAEHVPANFYCMDLQSRFAVLNERTLAGVGGKTKSDVIGKNVYELYKNNDIANELQKDIDKVMTTGITSLVEDKVVDVTTGKIRYFSATRAALRNKNGDIVGIVGTSIETTDTKEKELLELEAKANKVYLEEQEKFRKIVGQMAHDIRSPISTLKTVVQTADELAEQNRIALRRAAMNIEDITNHMLARYKPSDLALTTNNQRQYVLASATLSEIASERRYRYQNSLIKFELIINEPQINNFVFIKIEPSLFDRMLSNLINNAADSLPKTGGKIELSLTSTNEWVEITITDNGKGMSRTMLNKIKEGNIVSKGKEDGHGIGLTQVFDVVDGNLGEFRIFSNNKQPNRGTIIRVRFPKATSQQWLATEIKLTYNDIVIFIDDEASIHSAWDSKIAHILEKTPTMQIRHFMDGQEALQFITELSDNNKHNVCLLSDYELLKQDLNGLDIIKRSGVKRSILVTSHYANSEVLKLANQMAVKILPKDLVYSIPIQFEHPKYKPGELVQVHMVFVDDEIEAVKSLISEHYQHLLIDVYHNPFEFLKEVDKYPKDTKIIIDNNYYLDDKLITDLDGIVIAEQLHEKGFTSLYIYSWEKCKTPDYVTLILKTDRGTMAHLDQL